MVVKTTFLYLLIFTAFISCKSKQSPADYDVWQQADLIKRAIKVPNFKKDVYNIKAFGAVENGAASSSEAIKMAIKKCSDNGGGVVLIPKGKFLTGPIHLESNVNLHLEEGSELLFSTNPNDYYPLVHTSFEGIELMNYSPLIYAYKKKNIAITGKGILNGQASNDNWWTWKGSSKYGFKKGEPSQLDENNLPRLMKMAEEGAAVKDRIFGNGRYLRPTFFEPFDCENVLFQGVKVINAPFWILHPIKCKNVTIDGVNIDSHGPNNDGCDPEYCQNVWIKNCIFNTGDDCIAIKAGRDYDGRRVNISTENIIIENCEMIDGHGGVVIGSEMSAGVKNVFVQNCNMSSPNLDRAIRIKTNVQRGGFVDGLYVRKIKVGQVKECFLKINTKYYVYSPPVGNFIPKIKNLIIEDSTVENAGKYGIWAEGLDNSKIENVVFKNIKIQKAEEDFKINNVENFKIINSYINNKKIDQTITN